MHKKNKENKEIFTPKSNGYDQLFIEPKTHQKRYLQEYLSLRNSLF